MTCLEKQEITTLEPHFETTLILRVVKAWTDNVGAEWEKLYTAALQKKFLWVQNEKLDWEKIAQE